MNIDVIKKLNIPKSPGIYKFMGARNKIIYVGKAVDLRSRVLSYWRTGTAHSPVKHSMLKQIKKVDWVETESEIEALLLEANLIKKYQPQYNISLRDDKRFIYIKITTEDEVPGVFMTRKLEKSGKYFGPFTSVEAVRETLKAIRKIWPYCAERKIKSKSCFYYQIDRCLGICAGKISREEYIKKVIKPIILFFEGKKNKIISNFQFQIFNFKKDLKELKPDDKKYNEIQIKIDNLQYQLFNMKKVLAHANVLSVGEKYANDVVELAKILGFIKLPKRIEGYDISNVFGQEAVGSMVVFSGGEPDKNEYRKFKIKIKPGEANDVGMLREILERRLKRVPLIRGIKGVNESAKKNNPPPASALSASDWRAGPDPLYQGGAFWPLPDLIIIDGGKPQLNVASRILKKFKLEIAVVAISKGDGLRSARALDKLFFPGEKKPLELPLASPALHLIKRVRDEAHRFAITYHRKLKRKKMHF